MNLWESQPHEESIEQEVQAGWEPLASTFEERKKHTWKLFIAKPWLAGAVRKKA